MIRYGIRFGCRWGMPHDLIQIKDAPQQKWERCRLCNKTFRWNKGCRGRVDNAEYLKAHVRNFAQRTGPTRRIYMKAYQPDKCIIHI